MYIILLEQKKGTTSLINKIQNRDFSHNNEKLIEFYENIRNYKMNAFNNINYRFKLFYLFKNVY